MRALERAAETGGWAERRALLVEQHRARGCYDEVERRPVREVVLGGDVGLTCVRHVAVPELLPRLREGWWVRRETCVACGAVIAERLNTKPDTIRYAWSYEESSEEATRRFWLTSLGRDPFRHPKYYVRVEDVTP